MVLIHYMVGDDMREASFMTDSFSVAMDEFYSFYGDVEIFDMFVLEGV